MTITIEKLKEEHKSQLEAMQKILITKDAKLKEVEKQNEKLESLVLELSNNNSSSPNSANSFWEALDKDSVGDIARYHNALLSILAILFESDYASDNYKQNFNSIGTLVINALLSIDIYEETQELSDVGADTLSGILGDYKVMLSSNNVSPTHHLHINFFGGNKSGTGQIIEFSIVNQ